MDDDYVQEVLIMIKIIYLFLSFEVNSIYKDVPNGGGVCLMGVSHMST